MPLPIFNYHIGRGLDTQMSKPQEHLRVWDSSNIAESFPGIVSPLTFSIARRGYELVYMSQAYEAGFSWYELEAQHRTFNAMVGIFAGRMYYNLLNWYKFIGLFPNNSQQLQTIGDPIYLPSQNYPARYRLRYWRRMLRRILFFEREQKRYSRYLDDALQAYGQLPKDNDLLKQLERYVFLEQLVVPHMGRAADNDFFVMTYHGILKKKLQAWLGEPKEAKHDFLGALHDVISARQAMLLTEIADSINKDPRAARLLLKDAFQELDTYLLTTKARHLIAEYRDKFLHRFAEDQKVEAKNPLLHIDGFYALIKTYAQLNIDKIKRRQEAALINEREKDRAITRQVGPFNRYLYIFLVRRLKHHLRIREHNRLLRGKVYALLRDLFVEVGVVMTEKGLLDKADNVYYLEVDELFQLIDGSGYGRPLQSLAYERRAQYEGFRQVKAPARFMTKGVITKLPPEFSTIRSTIASQAKESLSGTIASPGIVDGKVIVLDEPVIPSEPFDILVVSHTDPGWTPLIALAKGLVVEHGGILSHAAIVTRELGIPSIIGIEGATTKLQTGQMVRLDATKGVVEVL